MDEDYGYEAYERDDDYNVFEENQLDLDRAAGEYDSDDWEEEDEDEDFEPEPREDFGFFGEAGVWD